MVGDDGRRKGEKDFLARVGGRGADRRDIDVEGGSFYFNCDSCDS